jgi:hypothetical protein
MTKKRRTEKKRLPRRARRFSQRPKESGGQIKKERGFENG